MKEQLSLFSRYKSESKKRDKALDLLQQTRALLIAEAEKIAVKIENQNGRVTSPEVVQILIKNGYGEMLSSVDRRFMGAVFRKGKGWIRIGFEPEGSHAQPISIWRLNK